MKIRSVRPDFFNDTKMAQLSPLARLLYIGLWCVADDEGRGRLLPKQLEGEIFPHEFVDFTSLWSELVKLERVVPYEVDGDAYWMIPRFEEYQKPNRKYKSVLPEPPVEPDMTLFAQDAATFNAGSAQRVDTAHAHAGEGEGEVAAAVDVGDGFGVFHRERAAAEYQRRGKPALKSKSGYIKSIADDPEFTEESKRIWSHRNCPECKGSGFRTFYSPGSGAVDAPCEVLS